MKKLLLLAFLLSLFNLPITAQLPDGVVAPNFTATDINGNTWTLYDLLDQGKSAVLFFGATWSYNSWQYHQSGRLKQVWEQYGPDGSNEIIPFFIEVDDNTDAADLDGTGDATYGDWVTGTPYPILDGANWLAQDYALDDVPRVYHICPNRILTNAYEFPTVQFELAHNDCLLPAGVNNGGLLRFVGLPKEFCGSVNFSPNIRFQNLGTASLNSLELELYLNGSLVETRTWTGNIALYQTAGIVFNPVSIDQTTIVEARIVGANGLADDDTANDELPATVSEGPAIATNFLVVEIKTDYYPREIYWEILDDAGNVFNAGGNPGIFVDEEWEGAYTESETVYQHEVALPADGCYEFVIYDQYDDGICCNSGYGYYRLQDKNNFIYLQGGLFKEPEHRPFSLSGAATINDNATILGYMGPNGDFCGEPAILPSVIVQNLGANPISSLDFKVFLENNLVQTYSWSGNLLSSQIDTINLDPVVLDTTSKMTVVVDKANQAPDTFFYNNDLEVRFTRRLPQTPSLVLEIETDEWGYENYWQITNSAGDIIASGGNQNIGPDGGGLKVATADDPGAYPQFSNITENIALPEGVNDCYTFLFVDDWADGINSPGYMKLTDSLGTLLFDFRPRTTGETYLIDGQFGPSTTAEPLGTTLLMLSPNPATDHLDVSFSQPENSGIVRLELLNMVGQVLKTAQLPSPLKHHRFDISELGSGVYSLKMTSEDGGITSRKFIVGR